MTALSSLRRLAAVAVLGASAALLAACGSGSVADQVQPTRFLSVGDGFSDIGQSAGGMRPTVNDGVSPGWTQELAAYYGLSLTAANAGGLSWAQAGARVSAADTSGLGAPSITQQVDHLLATQTLGPKDVVVLSAGISDIVAEVQANGIGQQTTDAVRAAGTAYGQQVRRLVDSGAKYVLVSGVFNLGITPWAQAQGASVAGGVTDLSVAFNNAAVLAMIDLSSNVLFVDPSLIFNLAWNKPGDYGLDDARTPVCTTPTALSCTSATLLPGADPKAYMFADALYLTPEMLRRYGDSNNGNGATYRFRLRW